MKSVAEYATFTQLFTVDWNKTVSFALKTMREIGKSCLLVVGRKGEVLGIITEHDKESEQRLSEFCTERKFETISEKEARSMDSSAAARYMKEKGFHRIVIKEGDKIGIFTCTDLIRMVADGG
jgi:CBS domain-containing protein